MTHSCDTPRSSLPHSGSAHAHQCDVYAVLTADPRLGISHESTQPSVYECVKVDK